jgi:acetyl coenzyme A synthetase (ADP forming)-like protein
MQNLDSFFNPQSIAVIGASRTQGKVGYTILENIKLTFKGKIYPINPNTTEIMGLNCFPSVLSIKEPIDLAVIAVPAEEVHKVLEECIGKKIRSIIIIASGFSEIGEKELELKLKDISKGKSRIIGPNCLGIYQKNLDTMFLPIERLKRPFEGSISFISQSGAVGSALIDVIANEGVGISKFISIGNRVDVSEIELLEYLGKDLNTRAIALYIESIADGKDFVEVAKKITKKKPVVAFKAGKTHKGSEAVASHTGSLAGEAEIYSAGFKQAGIIEAESLEDIFDFSKALASQPAMKDNKIAIVTDGGGFGIVGTDAAIKLGLELPRLSSESEKSLKNILPKYGVYHNPIDLTGDATSERYHKVLDVVFKDKNISGVIVMVLFQVPLLGDDIIDVLRDCKIYGKPFVVCSAGGSWVQEKNRKLEGFGIPVYPMPERGIRALWSLYEYGQILKRK